MVIKVDKLHLFEFFSRLYSKHFVCLQVNVKWWCVDVVFGVFLMCSSWMLSVHYVSMVSGLWVMLQSFSSYLVMVAMIYFLNCHLLFAILKWWNFQHKRRWQFLGKAPELWRATYPWPFIFRVFWVCLCQTWWEKCSQHKFLWNSFLIMFSRFSLHWKF